MTVLSEVISNQHEPVPEHAHDHHANVEPVAGMAFIVACVAVYPTEHTVPQLMPAGIDRIVPVPVPVFEAVIVYFFPKDA